LRAQLAIEPHSESSCAVASAGVDATAVTQQLKSCVSEEDTAECHAELSFDDAETERQYLSSSVSSQCICPVFKEHDCIPSIRGVRSGSIVVVLTIPERSVLREVISGLRAVGATVTVDWLVDGTDSTATTEIDVTAVTDKQREAMECAREMGYYDTPRRADLGDVAEELGISESATSQRLNGAESKLVAAFLDE
jgi:predicted DNA binding protein